MLTPRRLAAHLIDRGLLSTEIVDAGLKIVRRRRNNLNYEVVATPRAAYFTKESRSRDPLDVEARFYAFAGTGECARGLRRYVTSLCDYDPDRRILVLKLIRNGRNLSSILASNARTGLRMASQLGTAAGAIHDCPTGANGLASADTPWIFSLPVPGLDLVEEMSGANADLLRIVQRSRVLCRCIEQLSNEWREISLIHGDLRLANCIAPARRRHLKIADWEMSGFGDPAWDVGCLFASFLALWIASMFVLPDSTAGRLMRSARVPLPHVQAMIGRFWTSYRSSRQETPEFLLRSVRFAAARLVQTAYERMRDESAITGEGVVFLQVAANIAARPRRALPALLGIE